MATINKASLFDDEIAQTAKTLEELALANAPFAELEACRVKLSTLIDEKRKHLFAAPDPAYFIDEFLRCAPIEAQRVKAGELAELALGAINDILESTEEYDPLDFETYSAMHEFFDHFSRPGKDRHQVDTDNDTPALPESQGRAIKTFEDLSEQFKVFLTGAITGLVKRGFLTPENGRRMKYRLEKLPNKVKGMPIIWNRDATSLATAIVVADWLSEIELPKRQKRESWDREAKELGSNYLVFLSSNFDVRDGGNSDSTYFRALTHAESGFRKFLLLVNKVRSERKHGLSVSNDPADIVPYFFIQLSNSPKEQERIRNTCKDMDFGVLEAYADSITNKKNQGSC